MSHHSSFSLATAGVFSPPLPQNEVVLPYGPNSAEKTFLKGSLYELAKLQTEVPIRIGGEKIRTGNTRDIRMPHKHNHLLGQFHQADDEVVDKAIASALEARHDWSRMPWEARLAIFMKAADLAADFIRPVLNASTMLGQSKTVHQAEIDSACELIDFLRFNAFYAYRIYCEQPASTPNEWNRSDYRPLEGFVYAVSPFNFTAIACNLPTAPAIMGNTVVWKPASSAVLSAHYIMILLEEAGLPPGVINMIPGSGPAISERVLAHPELAGVHFTGSTEVFQGMWKTVGNNIANYRTYPRLVGETGGKDFVIAHPSADVPGLVTSLVRGAFEYQGQKCSAASRAYIAQSMWDKIRDDLIDETESLMMGDVENFANFLGAVIDRPAYDRITGYIERAIEKPETAVLAGGTWDDEVGYFVRPTILHTADPHAETMEEEIFGPVLTIYVYPDQNYEDVLDLCDRTSPYALTGAIFARDRRAILTATDRLTHSAGNFYINDKPTGAVVGRQPFGGARASGTNDKAGSMLNLLRWVSPRTIKETFSPTFYYQYPHMIEP